MKRAMHGTTFGDIRIDLNVAEQELLNFCKTTGHSIPSCLWTDEYRQKAIDRTLELDGWCRILKRRLGVEDGTVLRTLNPAEIRLLRTSIAMNTGHILQALPFGSLRDR